MSTSVHTSTVHFPSHPLAWDQHHCAAILLSTKLEPGNGLGIEADLRCRIRGFANGGANGGGRERKVVRHLQVGKSQDLGDQAESM